MRRAPIVLTSTAAGLALVLGFHTHGTHTNLVTGASTPGSAPPTSVTPAGTSGAPTAASGASGAPTTAPASTLPRPVNRSATGSLISYRYGDIQLKVTASGSSVTNIAVVQEDATDPRSEIINSEAIPLLQSEAMSAKSASIDGVSGATYTSEAYAESLQAALDKLGIQ